MDILNGERQTAEYISISVHFIYTVARPVTTESQSKKKKQLEVAFSSAFIIERPYYSLVLTYCKGKEKNLLASNIATVGSQKKT